MSDKELEIVEDEEVLEAAPEAEEVVEEEVSETDDELEEAKSSHGDPSEVPDPGTKQAAPPKTKTGMIQAMVNHMNGKKKDELAASYKDVMAALDHDDDGEDDEAPAESKRLLPKKKLKLNLKISTSQKMLKLFSVMKNSLRNSNRKLQRSLKPRLLLVLMRQLKSLVLQPKPTLLVSKLTFMKKQLRRLMNTSIMLYPSGWKIIS